MYRLVGLVTTQTDLVLHLLLQKSSMTHPSHHGLGNFLWLTTMWIFIRPFQSSLNSSKFNSVATSNEWKSNKIFWAFFCWQFFSFDQDCLQLRCHTRAHCPNHSLDIAHSFHRPKTRRLSSCRHNCQECTYTNLGQKKLSRV